MELKQIIIDINRKLTNRLGLSYSISDKKYKEADTEFIHPTIIRKDDSETKTGAQVIKQNITKTKFHSNIRHNEGLKFIFMPPILGIDTWHYIY